MTVAAHRAPNGDERLRIAITSPDILAQIRQVFAGKNLVVDIVGMPYVEVAVRPAGRSHTDRSAAGNALRTLTKSGLAANTRAAAPAQKRLRAEYRLSVIRPDEDRPRPEREARPARQQPRRHHAGRGDAARSAGTGTGATPSAGAGSGSGKRGKAGGGGREIALSQRQCEVMELMSRGARNAEIAQALHVTEKTVKNHINRIFRELGAGGRVEAVLLWQRYQAEGGGRWPVG
jgi:DNA-binding CsgD family transcriptional regulator